LNTAIDGIKEYLARRENPEVIWFVAKRCDNLIWIQKPHKLVMLDEHANEIGMNQHGNAVGISFDNLIKASRLQKLDFFFMKKNPSVIDGVLDPKEDRPQRMMRLLYHVFGK
jgi:hypothetical protein